MFRLIIVALAMALSLYPYSIQAKDGFYGSMRLGLVYDDPGGSTDAKSNFRDFGTRVGYLNSRELDTGLITFGQLEVGINSSANDDTDQAFFLRQAFVGAELNIGNILIGKTYHTWYNTIIDPLDQPLGRACNGCISYTGRAENGLTYSNRRGAVTFGATIHMRAETDDAKYKDEIDGIELGVSFKTGVTVLGLGYQDWDDGGEAVLGAVVNGFIGQLGYAASLTAQQARNETEDDGLGFDVFFRYQNIYLDVGRIDRGDASLGVSAGYTLPIDAGATIWFELNALDSGIDQSDPALTARAAFKYDWQ